MKIRSNNRPALTLVEMLVVIFIVGLLAAITIPAVMQAREAARRTQCSNNLKQLAIAINAHLEQKNFYPREENSYSAFVFMLPYLEKNTLFNSLNFAKPRNLALGPRDVNFTAFATNISTYNCPNDSANSGTLGAVSYAGNLGTGVGRYGRPDNGPFASSIIDPKIRDSLILDGLANTIAVSEFCRTKILISTRDRHAIFQLGQYNRDQFSTMVSDCSNLNPSQNPTSPQNRGLCWGFDGLSNTSYDHNIVPNGHTCTCRGILAGAWTASSYHTSGVNCAHLDGHVSFIKNSISSMAWRAIGTMNGGEITPTNL